MEKALIGLDPLFDVNVKIFIKTIHDLQLVKDPPFELFHFYDHIIKLVDICGIIVGVETFYDHTVYTIDDSSGTIPCFVWSSNAMSTSNPLNLGTLVQVFGKVIVFHDGRHIRVSDIFELTDPNTELVHTLEVYTLDLKYKKPYKLPKQIQDTKQELISAVESKSNTTDDHSDVDLFTKAIYNFLLENTKNHAFMVNFVKRNETIMKIAQDIVSKKYSSEFIEDATAVLYRETFYNLLKKGFIRVSKRQIGMFEVIKPTKIEQFILRLTLNTQQQQSGLTAGGVTIEYIRTLVSEEYEDLDLKEIDYIVDKLHCKGYINAYLKNEYKAF